MSLQNALGIKSSQLKVSESKQSKKTNDCETTLNCRNQMRLTEQMHTDRLEVKHFVKVKENGEDKYRIKTSIVQGNVAKHPTNKDLKIVEVLHIYKETIESDESNIVVLNGPIITK